MKKKKDCWPGWEKQGTKTKNGRQVNNCVKKKSSGRKK
tara:strand:- start:266 stop:379 length:114 start_codon:yes stop_codon:yes gene_type:complete